MANLARTLLVTTHPSVLEPEKNSLILSLAVRRIIVTNSNDSVSLCSPQDDADVANSDEGSGMCM